MNSTDHTQPVAEWLRPRAEQEGLERYAVTLRERFWWIVVVTLLTTTAAVVYVLSVPKVYESHADLRVTPISADEPAFAGLGLISSSNDPTQDVETAARLVTIGQVADRVRETLPGADPAQVRADPVGQSTIIAVTAEGPTAVAAQRLADAFAEAAVADRTADFHRTVDGAITRLSQRASSAPPGQRSALEYQLAQLQTLRAGDDPTLRLASPATVANSPSSPKPLLSVVVGVLAGLLLGVGGAFGTQMLDPRLRREQQLRDMANLPILARIPRETPGRQRRRLFRRPFAHGESVPLRPEQASPSFIEAFRTLRASLVARAGAASGQGGRAPSGGEGGPPGGPRSILITGSGAGEGKTTTALALASSLAAAGHRTILIEADLRRPALGQTLAQSAEHGTVSVLTEAVTLDEALITTEAYGPNLRFLLARYGGFAGGAAAASLGDWLFLPAAQRLTSEAQQLADYVIIDSPPLAEVIDALALAQRADDVVLVVKVGRTNLAKLRQLAELLVSQGVTPTGYAVVGVSRPTAASEYYVGATTRATPTGTQRGGEAATNGRNRGIRSAS